MSMNLQLVFGTGKWERACDLYQTPTRVTYAALASSDPYTIYAAHVRESFAADAAETRDKWDYDENEVPYWEHHLRHVELLIAFGARFVMT